MIRFYLRLCYLIAITMLSGCNKELEPRQYIKWVEDPTNGLNITEKRGDFAFVLQYKPLPYIALREIGLSQLNKKSFEKEIANTEDIQYYTFRIATSGEKSDVLKYGITSQEEYYARIQYFSFIMQEDIKLVDNGEELPCTLFHYERDYGVSPFQTFLLGFPLTKNKSLSVTDKVLIYDDKVLGVDKVSITIKGKDIEKIPSLNI